MSRMRILGILAILPALAACDVYSKIQNGKIPKYEVGNHAGAEACRECHEKQYEEWSNNSAHATATVNRPFLDFKAKFTDVAAFDAMMGEEMNLLHTEPGKMRLVRYLDY